jgi:hypothetical protein
MHLEFGRSGFYCRLAERVFCLSSVPWMCCASNFGPTCAILSLDGSLAGNARLGPSGQLRLRKVFDTAGQPSKVAIYTPPGDFR